MLILSNSLSFYSYDLHCTCATHTLLCVIYTGVCLLIIFLEMAKAQPNVFLGSDQTVLSSLSGKDHQPLLVCRGAPGEDTERDNVRTQPTLLLATPHKQGGDPERDCGKCFEKGNRSVMVIGSKVFGDPNCPQKAQSGGSVIHKAIKEGDLDSVKYYHSTTPGILDSVVHLGRNAFHLACWYGQFLVAIFLTSVPGISVTATDNHGWSALHYACDCIHPQLDIVKYLVENLYLDPRQETENGNTSVVLAEYRRHTGIIKYLVDVMKSLKPTDPKDQRPVLLLRDLNDANDYHSLQHGDHPNGDRNMSKLENRLFTFTMGPGSWPRAHPTERQLAEQGFMYLGLEERVMCFCCKALVFYWDDGVDPIIKHYRENSSCQFLLGNFRLQLDRLLVQQRIHHFNPRYSNNSARLHSFQSWSYSSIVSSYKLASVGFYYLGRGSKVQCFSCGLIHERWLRGDIPMDVHKRLNPTCQFLRSLEPQVPVSPPPSNTLDHSAQRIPTLKPDYEKVENRIKSFKLLSKDFPISPQDCADAGLFFIRKPDVMQCFKCDAIVSGWVYGDVAVEKHREVSPDCKFLREFFPSKLDLHNKQYDSSSTIDPSTLPEPHFTREDLEHMATKEHDSYNPLPGMTNLSLTHSDHTPSYSYTQQPVHPAYNHPQTRLTATHERYSLPEYMYSQCSSESSGYASAYPTITPTDRNTSREEFSDTTQLQRRYFQEGYTTNSKLTSQRVSSVQQSFERTVSYLLHVLCSTNSQFVRLCVHVITVFLRCFSTDVPAN